MQDVSALARPYGLAAFKEARDEGKVDEWSEMLELLVRIMQDPTMRALVANPNVNHEQLAALIIDVAGDGLSKTGRNLVRILAENERLPEMEAIAVIFARERDALEGRSQVDVTSAFELTEEQRQRIGDSMRQHLGTEVDVSVKVDKSLIGGVVIRSGDTVIDASLRGRLSQLGQSLGR